MPKSKKTRLIQTIYKNIVDAVRWFILSDSPPDKDIQWSDVGVNSSNKFMQKILNLNMSVKNRKDRIGDEKKTAKLNSIISNYVFKIDTSLSEFKLNVSIALFYEIYKVLNQHLDENIKNKHLIENVIKL